MIKVKKAPAGFIGQIYKDDSDTEWNGFLDVTGKWTTTLEDAVTSVKKERTRKITNLQRRIESLRAQIKELEDASDVIVEK